MRGAALALGLGLAACGQGPVLLVDIDMPAGVTPQKLQVFADQGALDDARPPQAKQPVELEGSARRLTLELPRGASGTVHLSMYGTMEDRCVGASGAADLQVDGGAGPYHVSLKLASRNFRVCDGKGSPLRAVAVLPGPVIFAVGDGGRALRWDAGRGWIQLDTGTSSTLYGVWGQTESALWAVGEGGTILRWSGSAFAADASGVTTALYGIAAESPSEVWAVGEARTVLRYKDGKWAPAKVNWPATDPMDRTLSGVAAAARQVLVVGDGGTMLRWDAGKSEFNKLATVVTDWLRAVAIEQSGVTWAVGAGGRVLRLDGGQMGKIRSNTDKMLTGLWASNADDMIAVGERGVVLSCGGATDTTPCKLLELGVLNNLSGIAGQQRPDDLWFTGAYSGEGGAKDVLLHYRPAPAQ